MAKYIILNGKVYYIKWQSILYEPTLKSKAYFRCLFITKIISG